MGQALRVYSVPVFNLIEASLFGEAFLFHAKTQRKETQSRYMLILSGSLSKYSSDEKYFLLLKTSFIVVHLWRYWHKGTIIGFGSTIKLTL